MAWRATDSSFILRGFLGSNARNGLVRPNRRTRPARLVRESVVRKLLCLDFDGVIHSYSNGWKGPRTIPDAPVPGALEFIALALESMDVAIYSSRSHALFGRWAMKAWLRERVAVEFLAATTSENSDWYMPDKREASALVRRFGEAGALTLDMHDEIVGYASREFVRAIQWPKFKPPAFVGLDDRQLTFNGNGPSIDDLHDFKPWNKRV